MIKLFSPLIFLHDGKGRGIYIFRNPQALGKALGKDGLSYPKVSLQTINLAFLGLLSQAKGQLIAFFLTIANPLHSLLLFTKNAGALDASVSFYSYPMA